MPIANFPSRLPHNFVCNSDKSTPSNILPICQGQVCLFPGHEDYVMSLQTLCVYSISLLVCIGFECVFTTFGIVDSE